MQIVRTTIANKPRLAALAVRAAVVGACTIFVCGCNTVSAGSRRSRCSDRLPPAPSDHDQRNRPYARSLHRFQPRRTQRHPTRRGCWNSLRPGGAKPPAVSWSNYRSARSNEHAAAEVVHTIRSLLAATGVPPNGIVVRRYQPPNRNLATIRITYPRISAQAGPCGLWPADIGPSFNRDHFENQPWWNAGCATQRNLAAMVDNPADLVQPRAEAPIYTMRRTTVVEKYRGRQPNRHARSNARCSEDQRPRKVMLLCHETS